MANANGYYKPLETEEDVIEWLKLFSKRFYTCPWEELFEDDPWNIVKPG